MDFFEVVQKRRSVRAYMDKPVEDDKLKGILEAARLAPSGSNRQMWKFIVVRNAATREALANAAGQAFLAKAPVIIATVSLEPNRVMHCGIPSGPVDCAIAIEHMALSAAALGLGACWIGHFDQDACRKILGVPESAKIIEMLTVGYPADAPKEKSRKPLGEIVSYEKF
ncbi:MAG: nitroreductase family protein [Phycisphaerae bacterium]